MSQQPTLDTIDIIRPENYAEHGYPHEAWKLLRRQAPSWRCVRSRSRSFGWGMGSPWGDDTPVSRRLLLPHSTSVRLSAGQ